MKKLSKLFYFLFIFFAINIFIGTGLASAKCTCGGQLSPDTPQANCYAPACVWTADSTTSDGGPDVTIGNPLGDNIKTPQQLIGRIINTALGLVGSLALLMFIYGGFMWMTAAGNDDRIKKGKETLTWATLGLIVIFSSYALVNYLIKNVIKGG